MNAPATDETFEIVPWSRGFEVGISVIDEQHQQLVKLLNMMAAHYVEGLSPDRAHQIFDELANYAVYHFKSEEALWLETLPEDRWTQDHLGIHHAFERQVGQWRDSLRQRPISEVVDGALGFLTRWLAHHILYEDRRMAHTLLAMKAGATLEEAKRQAQDAMSGQTSRLINTVLSMYEALSSRTLGLQRESIARQRAEEALRRNDAQWRLVIGSTHDTLWDWDVSELPLEAEQTATLDARLEALLQQSLGPQRRVHPDDWPALRDALTAHLNGRTEVFAQPHRVLDDTGKAAWIMTRGKAVSHTAQGRPQRMVGTHTDITERKLSEANLLRQRDSRQLISEFAADFMATSLSDIDAAIDRALQRSGNYLGADRAYVFMLSPDGALQSNTHEWSAPGIEAQREQLQDIPVEATPWWWQQLREQGVVLVPDVQALPPEAAAERQILQDQGIRSVCVTPLRLDDHLAGFVGYDVVRQPREWDRDALEFLTLMSDLMGIALNHRRVHQLREQALLRLEEAEQLARIGHWEQDLRTQRLWWSDEVYRIFEADPRTFRPSLEAFSRLVHPDDLDTVNAAFQDAVAQRSPYLITHRLLLPGGRVRHVEARGTLLVGTDGEPLVARGTVQDVSERMEHQRELERLAYHDALTGLPNWALLAQQLPPLIQRTQKTGQPFALGFLDLDDFKAINDRYGHAVGDQLIAALGQRIRLLLNRTDVLARAGGDEFILLLTDTPDPREMMPLLLRLLQAVGDPVTIDGIELSVSASLGLSTYPQDLAVDADQLLRQAQQALYRAKLDGKNRFHFYNTEEERGARDTSQRLAAIEAGLAQGQFVLHYQPKVHMRTAEVVGLEALVRWNHPERGLLSPADFLPVIKDHPLDVVLGEWVLRQALQQMAAWQQQGLTLQVSVNIGAMQLQQSGFVQRLEALLQEVPQVSPASLQLEVLESSAMQDLAGVSQIMHRCRELGVTFALDDFGTGYSSLTYLKHLPAAVLKIDQGFVRDILERPDDLSIVSGVVGMAKAFGLQVIAEGVESADHGDMLLRLGCELAQGYGIARPMPAADIPAWVRNWIPPPAWKEPAAPHPEDLPLLYASVEHRAWVHALERTLRSEQDSPPQPDHRQCRLGRWLTTDGARRYSHHPHFAAVLAQHEGVHRLGQELLRLKSEDRAPQALARLPELQQQRDALLRELMALLR